MARRNDRQSVRLEASFVIDSTSTLRRVDPKVGPRLVSAGGWKIENTLFGRTWALAFWDEAQWLRTEGHLSRAACALRVKSASTILCSATPLHNGERVSGTVRAAGGLADDEPG